MSYVSAQATGFCFNDRGVKGSSDFVFAAAHTTEFHVTSQDHYPVSTSLVGKPKQYVVGEWYYTEACLDGLTEVRLCIDECQSIRPCIGLLLQYSHGHSRSLMSPLQGRSMSLLQESFNDVPPEPIDESPSTPFNEPGAAVNESPSPFDEALITVERVETMVSSCHSSLVACSRESG